MKSLEYEMTQSHAENIEGCQEFADKINLRITLSVYSNRLTNVGRTLLFTETINSLLEA